MCKRWLVLTTVLWLAASCGNVPKLPYPPPPQPRTLTLANKLYVPLALGTPTKLGVAGCGQVAALGGSWCYSWSPWPGAQAGIETVPMIRDASNVTVTQLGGNSAWLMGFNEPDLCPEQACLTPDAAAQLWRVIEARWPERKLVAPVPSHLHPEWLAGFYAAYVTRYGQAPRLDAIAMHCYWRTAAQCITLAEEYEGLAEVWGIREGWVTEFAFTPTTANWQAQIAEWTTYLERSTFWTRFAPFVSHVPCSAGDPFWDCAHSGDPSLFDSFGHLTDVGRLYQRATE